MTTKRLRFGIATPQQQTTYEEILEAWLEADEEPLIEHMWVFDHFIPLGSDPSGPCLEGWATLAALAARTTCVRVGVLVSGAIYHNPAILAKHADVWSAMCYTAEDFRHKSEVLDAHCAAVGRDPATIERSAALTIDPAHLDMKAVRTTAQSFIEAGATYLIAHPHPPYPKNLVRLMVDEVFAPLQAEYA
jgi:alkanesulfonate monooxygenase SsuD/methylene tetrahydromethanopterin reductase-like flavin-dependent oxidoreductase (luciferase family)